MVFENVTMYDIWSRETINARDAEKCACVCVCVYVEVPGAFIVTDPLERLRGREFSSSINIALLYERDVSQLTLYYSTRVT